MKGFYTHQRTLSGAVLGPMAGFTDAPFRKLCREQGAVWGVTEMVSSLGVVHSVNRRGRPPTAAELEEMNSYGHCRSEGDRAAGSELGAGGSEGVAENLGRSLMIGRPYPGEPDLVIQLFGSDPGAMAEAGQIVVEAFDPVALDINMGCPVRKVVKTGAGSALIADPADAARVAGALVRAVDVDVSVKIRTGYEADKVTAVEVARALEDEGVALICVHGRTRPQMYEGRADWNVIRRVRDAVSIPVQGSGDVTSAAVARRHLDEGIGVQVARGALGRPWVFRVLAGGAPPTVREVAGLALRHARMAAEWYGEAPGIRSFRGALVQYFKGFRGASGVRAHATRVATVADVEEFIRALLAGELVGDVADLVVGDEVADHPGGAARAA